MLGTELVSIKYICICILYEYNTIYSILSANLAIVTHSVFGKSLVHKKYNVGPKILPCRTPTVISFKSDY